MTCGGDEAWRGAADAQDAGGSEAAIADTDALHAAATLLGCDTVELGDALCILCIKAGSFSALFSATILANAAQRESSQRALGSVALLFRPEGI